MIPLLTKMAVDKKCEFDHVILLGNYELAYALGKLSRFYNIPKKDSFSSVGELKQEILSQIPQEDIEEVSVSRLKRIVSEMDTYTDEMNEQIYEVYALAFD